MRAVRLQNRTLTSSGASCVFLYAERRAGRVTSGAAGRGPRAPPRPPATHPCSWFLDRSGASSDSSNDGDHGRGGGKIRCTGPLKQMASDERALSRSETRARALTTHTRSRSTHPLRRRLSHPFVFLRVIY